MLPQEKVQNLIERHLKLERQLSSGDIEKKNMQKSQKSIQI